jgi:hypothetical protein
MRFRLRLQSEWAENLRVFWALAGLAVAAAALALGPHPTPRWIPGVQLVCWIMLLVSLSSGYCEFREDGLLLRRRGRKTLIPYNSLAELKPSIDSYGALALTNAGKRVPIPVALTPEFLQEAYRRLPRLNPASGTPSFALMR